MKTSITNACRCRALIAGCLYFLAAAGASAGCLFPGNAEIDMPDGATATQEQMVVAQAAVKTYVAEMEKYIACLDTEARALVATGVMTEEQREINTKRYNAAVELMQGVAEQFNVEVRQFRDANS